jgi:integrase
MDDKDNEQNTGDSEKKQAELKDYSTANGAGGSETNSAPSADAFVPEYVSSELHEMVSRRTAEQLDQELSEFYDYLLREGHLRRDTGLSESTAENELRRVDQSMRWAWCHLEFRAPRFGVEQLDAVVEALDDDLISKDGEPYAESAKRKQTNALQKYAEFESFGWTPPVKFRDEATDGPDHLEREEMKSLRVVVMEFTRVGEGTLDTEEQLEQARADLAQRIGKKKSEITDERIFEARQTWKYVAMIKLALDIGPRPALVERMETGWLQLQTGEIHVPPSQAVKNDIPWDCALQRDTVLALRKWLAEREERELYDGRDALFLTREGNRYQSSSLNPVFRDLLDAAGIEAGNRQLTWTSIRHGLGTKIAKKGALTEASQQLRHASLESTMTYVHPTAEDIRECL